MTIAIRNHLTIELPLGEGDLTAVRIPFSR